MAIGVHVKLLRRDLRLPCLETERIMLDLVKGILRSVAGQRRSREEGGR